MTVKKLLLPLADPVSRARSHLDDLTAEEPMLIPSEPTRSRARSSVKSTIEIPKEEFAALG